MSKLQASSVRGSIRTVLDQSSLENHKEAGGKKRNFVETIELQIGLKNYDPQRDKRFVSVFSGLPSCEKLTLSVVWYRQTPSRSQA